MGEVSISEMRRVALLEFMGDINCSNADLLLRQIQDQIDLGMPLNLVIDLSKVNRLTAAGIHILNLLATECRGQKGRFFLSQPNEHMEEVIDITGLPYIVFKTQVDAIVAACA